MAAETYTAALSLNSDTAESVTSAFLSGAGADSHSVSLTWAASTLHGVTGYNVYRSLQSGRPYTLLTASPVAGTTYTDDTVEAGTTYYYVVTAVASGSQSVYSNQAGATVPKDTSSTALASSLNPSTYGQSVTFTATVTSSGGTPTGTVTFKDGSTWLGAVTLSSGKATFTTKTLSVGSHSITGVYGGSTDFTGSTSPVLAQTVKPASSSTALASSLNPSTYGQSVTFTATVTSSGGTPTGTVTFKDGSTWLGAVTLSSGKATFTTKTLSVGSHSITGVYGGSTDFTGSTSPLLTQTVKAFTTKARPRKVWITESCESQRSSGATPWFGSTGHSSAIRDPLIKKLGDERGWWLASSTFDPPLRPKLSPPLFLPSRAHRRSLHHAICVNGTSTGSVT